MTPSAAIAMLDRQIAEHGEDVVLQTMTNGAVSGSQTVRAFVRGFKPDELIGGVQQGDSRIVLSPTGLNAVPKRNSKIVVASGSPRNVEAVEQVRLANTLVRVNITARG